MGGWRSEREEREKRGTRKSLRLDFPCDLHTQVTLLCSRLLSSNTQGTRGFVWPRPVSDEAFAAVVRLTKQKLGVAGEGEEDESAEPAFQMGQLLRVVSGPFKGLCGPVCGLPEAGVKAGVQGGVKAGVEGGVKSEEGEESAGMYTLELSVMGEEMKVELAPESVEVAPEGAASSGGRGGGVGGGEGGGGGGRGGAVPQTPQTETQLWERMGMSDADLSDATGEQGTGGDYVLDSLLGGGALPGTDSDPLAEFEGMEPAAGDGSVDTGFGFAVAGRSSGATEGGGWRGVRRRVN